MSRGNSLSDGNINTHIKAAYYARFFEVQKWTLYAPSVCDFIIELPCTSVESFARLYVKYEKVTTRITYGIRYQVFIASSSSQQVPRSYCCTARVTPLELSHGHHVSTRAASARAARTQASGDGTRMQGMLGVSRAWCRLCINSRAGSNSGSQQQQYEGLVDNS